MTCIYCQRRITADRWGIWRHDHSGMILCQPDEDAPDFTGQEGATPHE